MSNFIVQFPLNTDKFQEDILDKRLDISRQIYNSLINVVDKRYKEMIKTKVYRDIKRRLSDIYKQDKLKNKEDEKSNKKELLEKLNKLYEEYRLTEYSFHKDVKDMQKHFKQNIDSFTAQKIVSNLWKAYNKLLYGEGKKVYYKKYGALNTVEGKSNKTGIIFKDDMLIWNKLEIAVKIDYKNEYEKESLKREISYVRIVRKYVRNKNKYYVQIVFKGKIPLKRKSINEARVGLDIGTRTIAISSREEVKMIELADKVQNMENEKRKYLRKLDRSRRINNKENYNEDGTIKKQGSKKVIWSNSNKYISIKNKLKEIYRKQADVRKYQHEQLANHILELGTNVYVENMNYKGLQKRSKKTTINEKTGRINKKKRYGKSLANKAPAMLLNIINRKLTYIGKKLIKIETIKVRASQYNHVTNEYVKKALSERWNKTLNVQRDLYSAFLIMNVDKNLDVVNRDMCIETYDKFKIMHDEEINRLKNIKLDKKIIASIGI